MLRRLFKALPGALLLACAVLNHTGPVRTVRASDEARKLYLAAAVRHEARFTGAPLERRAEPLSLAVDDFDADGIGDLAAGYATAQGGRIAIFRGNLDAFAPQSERSFWAIARNEFPSPYLPDAQVLAVPDRPDLLAAGDFIGIDGPGVVAAAGAEASFT